MQTHVGTALGRAGSAPRCAARLRHPLCSSVCRGCYKHGRLLKSGVDSLCDARIIGRPALVDAAPWAAVSSHPSVASLAHISEPHPRSAACQASVGGPGRPLPSWHLLSCRLLKRGSHILLTMPAPCPALLLLQLCLHTQATPLQGTRARAETGTGCRPRLCWRAGQTCSWWRPSSTRSTRRPPSMRWTACLRPWGTASLSWCAAPPLKIIIMMLI